MALLIAARSSGLGALNPSLTVLSFLHAGQLKRTVTPNQYSIQIASSGATLCLRLIGAAVRWAPGPFGVFRAIMGCELFVALQPVVHHHFIERCAGGRTRRFEPPATSGTTKTAEKLFLDPYQLPAHGRLSRCAPTSTRLLSRKGPFRCATNGPFRSGVLPDSSRNPSPSLGVGKMDKGDGRSLHAPVWMVCRASYIPGEGLLVGTSDFGGLVGRERDRFECWSRFVRREPCA